MRGQGGINRHPIGHCAQTRPLRTDHQVVTIDASPSGVSGDKYLGALIDLGAKIEILRNVARVVTQTLPGSSSVEVKLRRVERGEISGQLVTIESEKEPEGRKGIEILHAAEKCVAKLGLSDWGSDFSQSTIKTLLDAESNVHGHSAREVELHELGSADTLIDVLGVARLAESLGLAGATWWSTPIPVGKGVTRFSNRTYPNPPPAVAEILRKNHFPTERGLVDSELSTPTGVAITVNLVTKYAESYPVFTPEKIGYGAGSKEFDEVSNVLRLTTGMSLGSSHSHDEMVILETNLDDVSGEVIGRAAERLMAAGARDVTITPVYMKKNRPGHMISVIASKDDVEKLADVLMVETGTLGVRELPISRHISPRRTTQIVLKVKGKDQRIHVKLSLDHKGRIVRAKPEYEDLKRISDRTGLSIREIQRIAQPKVESLQE
jgi:pyridinium-3,5-bisthiocarboxylic acid mononucleotide nickel chelatase